MRLLRELSRRKLSTRTVAARGPRERDQTMNRSITGATRMTADHSQRRVALATAFSLLFVAVLAAFAQFGAINTLIVPADTTATTNNIVASAGLFRAAIAAFLIVAILDVVVAWGLYVILRPANESLALLVAWLRVVYAAVFAYALVNLLDVAQLLQGTGATSLSPGQIQIWVASSIASFGNGWDLALAIFGLHLVGLGALLFRSVAFPRFLGALVVLAGVGYLADSFGTILVPDYSLTISVFTFLGEALLIAWLFKFAIKGTRSPESHRTVADAPARASEAAAS